MKLFNSYFQTVLSVFILLISVSQVVSGSNVCILKDSGPENSMDHVKALSEAVAGSSVSFSYSYSALRGKGQISGNGSAIVQDQAYLIDVDGLKFFCNGSTKWTVDYNSREVVIEAAEGGEADYYSNPVLLILSADKIFERESSENVSFNGSQALCVNLKPKTECGLEKVSLYFSVEYIIGACAVALDGTETSLEIKDFIIKEKKDLSYFMFDDKSLDSSWIVTDLR